jgi:hypothetical protein
VTNPLSLFQGSPYFKRSQQAKERAGRKTTFDQLDNFRHLACCFQTLPAAGALPVCMAKTQYSFSDNEKLLGAPSGFTLTGKISGLF